MHIVSLGDNVHEMSNPIFWEKKKKINDMSSAEFEQSMLSVKNLKKSCEWWDVQLWLCIWTTKIMNIFFKRHKMSSDWKR